MARRIERLNEQLKRELAVLIQSGLRDPRVVGVTVTAVRTTADLNLARVLVRLSGTDDEKAAAIDGLDRAAPWLRRELGRDLRIRRVPELAFQEDVAQERAARIEELLAEVRPEGGWEEEDGEDDAETPVDEGAETDR
ncbi:30S ribosome-binding factor RbfA [Gaopeijia maritima]|uniref:Ribosome-binding factor A n=1 Tax=Gaopeijia maritima TaxID=3119007 RepID=A0ABU9EBU0_9BACT